jgi:hypothetical protein
VRSNLLRWTQYEQPRSLPRGDPSRPNHSRPDWIGWLALVSILPSTRHGARLQTHERRCRWRSVARGGSESQPPSRKGGSAGEPDPSPTPTATNFPSLSRSDVLCAPWMMGQGRADGSVFIPQERIESERGSRNWICSLAVNSLIQLRSSCGR